DRRRRTVAQQLARALDETGRRLKFDREDVEKLRASISSVSLEDSWKKLSNLVGKAFRGRVSDYYVIQTQIRVFLIELTKVDLGFDQGIRLGLENRLDLMNAQAEVTDAWRNEEAAANQLLAGLSVQYQELIATDPNFTGFFRFDASAGNQRFGVTF